MSLHVAPVPPGNLLNQLKPPSAACPVPLPIAPVPPDIMLVDLPGIIQAELDKDESNVLLIKQLVEDYVKEGTTIIVAAIAGTDDLENQVCKPLLG